MGYESRLSGGFDIEPPITYREFITAGYDEDQLVTPKLDLDVKGGWGEIFFVMNRERVKTDDGYKVAVYSDRIECYEDSMKAYGLDDSIKHLQMTFTNDHKFSGSIRICGEEDGDIWRIRVQDNNTFVTEHPKLVWPDGSTTSL
jgi:hypothetical protein